MFSSLLLYQFETSANVTYTYLGDSVKQVDVGDVCNKLLHTSFGKKPDSLRVKPGKLLYACLPGVGYTLVTGLTFVVSNNVSFYTGNYKSTYLSSITTNAEFSLQRGQIIIPIESNIWSKNNNFNFLGDSRFLNYPSYTYGLGGHSSLKNADLIDYSYIRVYQEMLKHISSNYFVGLGYNLDYHYNIKEIGTGDFQTYNKNATQSISSGVLLHFIYDGRINVNSPLQGYYISVAFRPNLILLGSNQNWESLQLDLRKYIQLSSNPHNILALWSYSWFTAGGQVPYFDLPSTGWDTYSSIGRGYIQGRLRGSNLLYLEAEYRFGLTQNGLLGGVLFVNAQSVSEINSLNFETILPGEGIGLRFKVNKLSVANFCVDYAFGTQGSRGFFFNLCEYF